MTLRELMERVYWDSGEPSTMCPYDTPGDETTFNIASAGSVKLIRQLNSGLMRIANWRFRDKAQIRFRNLRQRMYFQSQEPHADTVISASDYTANIPGLAMNYADQFNGWIIAIDGGVGAGQTRLVVDTAINVDGVTVDITVDTAWDTNPDATSTYSMYKSFFAFVASQAEPWQGYHILVDPVGTLTDVLRVRDVGTQTDLARTYYNDLMTGSIKSTGVPSVYATYGNELWFDVAPTERRSYELLYMRNPAQLGAATSVPELPEVFHEAVALWTIHNVMRTNQDFNGAYATKRELEDLMETLRAGGEFSMELESGGLVVYG